jgi:trigger factor
MLKLTSMQINQKNVSSTQVKLTISADSDELNKAKHATLTTVGAKLKLPGFRPGKAPLSVIEKNADQQTVNSQFLDLLVNTLYKKAISKQSLRPVSEPRVSITKFVPFTNVEFEVNLDVIGQIKLADYHKIKKSLSKVSVTAKDVDEVLSSLQEKESVKTPSLLPVKKGDEVVIDFQGFDSKDKSINGAKGNNYPLIIGSNKFIPGFETNLIGVKADESKTFTVKFPKDYAVKTLASKNVRFEVKVKNVNTLTKLPINDDFAKKISPLESLKELKEDIKKHLLNEKQNQANQRYETDLIKEIVTKSKIDLPSSLIDQQVEQLKTETRQNLAYRGQTWPEMLKEEGLTEEQFVKKHLLNEAEDRVKAGLILAEIANKEDIELTKSEVDEYIEQLKSQYQDEAMRAQLDKPEAKQDIASRLITQKTIAKLVNIAKV